MLTGRATSTPQAAQEASPSAWQPNERTQICTSVTADSVQGMLAEIEEATAAGVDVIELRLDFLAEFNPETDLKALMDACSVPFIVTFRPSWEGCAAAPRAAPAAPPSASCCRTSRVQPAAHLAIGTRQPPCPSPPAVASTPAPSPSASRP
jgi:hypothetical protein